MTAEAFERMCMWLQGPAALDVRVDPDQPDASDVLVWDCDETHRFTLQWLRANAVDINSNLAVMRELGGYCDCEVWFNIALQARWPGQTPLPNDLVHGDDEASVGDDEALVAWLNGQEFSKTPPFLRNQRELHFHISLQKPDETVYRDLIKHLERLECTVTAAEAATITGYLEYNPRYRQDREATLRLHKFLNRWQRKGHLTWSTSRRK
jgi:hypothetical protein